MKELARAHRAMQADTLNSVVRALAPASVLRALRMRSLVRTLGLPVFADTDAVLVGAAARAGLPAEAADLYWCARSCRECRIQGLRVKQHCTACECGAGLPTKAENLHWCAARSPRLSWWCMCLSHVQMDCHIKVLAGDGGPLWPVLLCRHHVLFRETVRSSKC